MEERLVKSLGEWDGEDTNCIECGKRIHLFWNGGELDREECCGYIYQTEHVRVDLNIYKEEK